ncbi:MAG: hypothetical protein AAF628_16120 [Planctomycetota bacterium]
MCSDLNERLANTRAQRECVVELGREIARLEAELKASRAEARTLDQRLVRQRARVRDLSGWGWAGWLAPRRARRAARLALAREALARTERAHEVCARAMDRLSTELDEHQAERAALGDVTSRHRELMAQKLAALHDRSDVASSSVRDLMLRIEQAQADAAVTAQAISAADRALRELHQLADLLDGAQSWGWLDAVMGGALWDVGKYRRIRQAHAAIPQARECLRRLRQSLAVVPARLDLGAASKHLRRSAVRLEVGAMVGFADLAVDQLLVDALVQRKILRARERTDAVTARVRRIVSSLRRERKRLAEEAAELEAKRDAQLEIS